LNPNVLHFWMDGIEDERKKSISFVRPNLIRSMIGQIVTKIEIKFVHITLFISCKP